MPLVTYCEARWSSLLTGVPSHLLGKTIRDGSHFGVAIHCSLVFRSPGKACWSRVRKAALRKTVVDVSLATECEGGFVKAEVPNSARGKMQNVPNEPQNVYDQQVVESSSGESADEGPQEFPYRVLPPCRSS